jgi:hypothetical protein
MRFSIRYSTISRIAGAVAALWLCGAGAAWAGGGTSAAGLQMALGDQNGTSGLCSLLGMTSCPQLPTVTQLILQMSALATSPPDLVRSPQGAGLTASSGASNVVCSVAGNQALAPCSLFAINAINPAAFSANLSQLNPLAFLGPTTGSGRAIPVPTGTSANSRFYAVATTASGQPGQPDTLSLRYDYPPLTTATFAKGQQVAAISLPLVLLSNGTEQQVTTTLQISAACAGGISCLTATAVGNFSGNGTQKRSPGDLGITITSDFSTGHAVFSVQAPLVVTGPSNSSNCQSAINNGTVDTADCGNDPAYFGVVPFGATLDGSKANPNVGSATGVNQLSGLPTAFNVNDPGFSTAFLNRTTDGIAPYPAPAGTGATTSTFGFCASFWGGSTTNLNLNPAVAAFLSIDTNGTTYVSSPVQPPANVGCPF